MRTLRIAGVALAGGLSVAGALALAQDGGTGPRLSFGLNQTFDVNDNLDLDVESAGTTVQSLTGLSFGLQSETEISVLSFTAGTALRFFNQPDRDDDVEFDLDGTRISLGYDRGVANSALSVTGRYSMDQIDTTLTLADFGPGAVVPEDFSTLSGTGMRRAFGLGAALSLGLEAPVSYELSANVSEIGYSDTSDPDLSGNSRVDVGAAMQLRLNPVTTGRLGLDYGEFTSDNPDNEDSDNTGVTLDLTRALTNGNIGFGLFATRFSDSNDDRAGFSLSRSLELPAGGLSVSLGATEVQGRSPDLTGSIAWVQDLSDGALSLNANSSVRNDSDNRAQYVNGLRFGYLRELGPLSQIEFDISYALTEDVDPPSQTTSAASLSAIYSRALTEDWALDLGYTYRQRDEDDTGMARSNAVFVGLRRSWEGRP